MNDPSKEIAEQIASAAEAVLASSLAYSMMTKSALLVIQGKKHQYMGLGEKIGDVMDALYNLCIDRMNLVLANNNALEVNATQLATIADQVVTEEMVISNAAQAKRISVIKDFYVFIVIFDDGTEKLMILRQNGEPLPMIVTDRAMVETFRVYADQIVAEHGKRNGNIRYVVRHYRPSGIPVDNLKF